jgi:predicted P-loop ATPase
VITDDHTFDIIQAPQRNSRHWKPGKITWAELQDWMLHPASTKACGNYVLGTFAKTTVQHKDAKGQLMDPCSNVHRTKVGVRTRCALTLDIDYPDEGFEALLELQLPYAAACHTTHSSTKRAPRYRLIIPLDRPVAADEYHTAAGAVMQLLGEHQFDPGSNQPERYMFKPAAGEPGSYSQFVIPGPLASADKLLVDFQADLSALPAPKVHKNKRDPFAIEGTIGAFNRAYDDFAALIAQYDLPYQEAESGRWQLVGASAAAGMGEVAPGLVFSHHANDPAYGVTCSAFDLVRLHLHADLDEDAAPGTPVNRLPSHKAMLEMATQDVRVVQELVGSDFAQEMTATADAITSDNWRLGFRLDSSTGKPKDDIINWDLIADNDRAFQVLQYNELSMSIELSGDLPWRKVVPGQEVFGAGDRSALALYIERTYGIRPGRGYLDDMIADRALPRRVNPVRDYLNTLVWDGKPRVETCLPGVAPTPFARVAARKSMVAAVARMMDPGCKWDHMLILYGTEGLGKSYWVEKMAKGFSAALGRIGDKDTLLTMQRSWIMTSDEGHSLRKADFDQQKEFLTRTADVFRMPYEREALVHQRHCVIWGTTNDDVFLRKQEGNRRFLIVQCEQALDFDVLTDEYVDQVWAEALHLYRAGEPLFLNQAESALASTAREDYTEEDALTGIIQAYLDTPVPDEWDSLSPEGRQLWLLNQQDGFSPVGTQRIDQVCSLQVWMEAMGRRRGDHRRMDLLEITNALKALPGWRALPGSRRLPGYGPQKVFERIVEPTLEDLL